MQPTTRNSLKTHESSLLSSAILSFLLFNLFAKVFIFINQHYRNILCNNSLRVNNSVGRDREICRDKMSLEEIVGLLDSGEIKMSSLFKRKSIKKTFNWCLVKVSRIHSDSPHKDPQCGTRFARSRHQHSSFFRSLHPSRVSPFRPFALLHSVILGAFTASTYLPSFRVSLPAEMSIGNGLSFSLSFWRIRQRIHDPLFASSTFLSLDFNILSLITVYTSRLDFP